MPNLFRDIPTDLPEELIEVLVKSADVRIERIVSRSHHSAEDFWYEQGQQEFVVLLSGAASLEFEGCRELVAMKPGDYRIIAAHERHRVAQTAHAEDTVWLAIHFR